MNFPSSFFFSGDAIPGTSMADIYLACILGYLVVYYSQNLEIPE